MRRVETNTETKLTNIFETNKPSVTRLSAVWIFFSGHGSPQKFSEAIFAGYSNGVSRIKHKVPDAAEEKFSMCQMRNACKITVL